jgi:methyl-accepting chemotaxis protein
MSTTAKQSKAKAGQQVESLDKFYNMVENVPINVLLADTDLNLIYMNASSTSTLKTLEQFLPKPVEELVGESIDIFHEDPAYQRKILSNPDAMPLTAQINVGPETLSLVISAVRDSDENYIGPMVTWEVVTEKLRMEKDLGGQLAAISKAQAVIEFNMDGTIITANENFLVTLGYTLEEVQGQHHRIFVEPAFAASAEYTDFWAKLNRGEYESKEYKRLGKGGKEVWIQASYNPILDLNGNPFKVVKFATEVTQQREMALRGAMIAEMPGNVILANADLEITYLNPASVKQLTAIQQFLPVPVDEIVGQSVDIFHKDPAYQRGILSKPENLPVQAQIQVGPETLDLLVSAVRDADGTYIGPMVSWEVITEKLKAENEMVRVQNMMENIPVNVMLSNTDFEIVYMNPASETTLKTLEHLLPVKVDQLIGEKIDIFHKNPEMQRRIVGDPANLPHRAKIMVGDETLDLLVSAILDANGDFIGPMITWEVVTAQVELADSFERDIKGIVNIVTSSATEMQASSKSMAATSEETSRQSQVVAAASEEATKNVETVASATEELSASISEIANHVQEASKMTSLAVEEADRTNTTINDLGESSNEIGQVVKVITSIAQQTNLLALNATIEAARAGEAGKGFAVVANEVKELARQTAKATEEISQKISAIQGASGDAATAIESIGSQIGKINEIATTIAGAVEEQTAATNEISRNVAEASKGTAEVSSNIASVSQAAEEGGKGAADILTASDGLAQESARLDEMADGFLEKLRAV